MPFPRQLPICTTIDPTSTSSDPNSSAVLSTSSLPLPSPSPFCYAPSAAIANAGVVANNVDAVGLAGARRIASTATSTASSVISFAAATLDV